ncbi:BrnA antitoxin family protein [uncultured Methylobacterium sp.]|uniref:BrnA antitoxin family protein n=1 Tax=uncultured Methylobacterium sp. TaxID=157278 RepID=UPI0035CBCA60
MGDRLIERERRPGETERLVLPTDLVDRFRASGPDWQIRIEAAVRDWLSEHPDRL